MKELIWIIWSEIGALVLGFCVYFELYLGKDIIWTSFGVFTSIFMILVLNNKPKKKRKRRLK